LSVDYRPKQETGATQQQIAAVYGHVPLNFEANQGQTDSEGRFLARGKGYTLFLTPTEAILLSEQRQQKGPRHALRIRFIGANLTPDVQGLDEVPGKSNYLIGNRNRWHTKISNYEKVRYRDLYAGIDLVYYGNRGSRLKLADSTIGNGHDGRAAVAFDIQGREKNGPRRR
jgi:hypothetical protein